MSSPDSSLSLALLGVELDAARRSRGFQDVEAALDSVQLGTSGTTSLHSPTPSDPVKSESTAELSAPGAASEERPYPLCLLCLVRPPSAVLLPCCHLNICHLCAPLLFLKHRPPPPADRAVSIPAPTPAPDPTPATTGTRASRPNWNAVLMKATANHPKSRRMSMGGYVAPTLNTRGGEATAEDLCSSLDSPGTRARRGHKGVEETCREIEMEIPGRAEDNGQSGNLMGIRAQAASNGAISLLDDGETAAAAKCMMCRAGVKGWLRVYAG